MNTLSGAAEKLGELPPLQTLLLAYAPPDARLWQRLCWIFDQRLAVVVRRPGEPTLKAIRLAWWDDVLVQGDRAKGNGEPLVELWRTIAPAGAAESAERVIDGWRMLLGEEPLTAEDLAEHGRTRGGGLFGLLAGETGEALDRAGTAWALWDFAIHAGDSALARIAMEQARIAAQGHSALPRGRSARPLRLLHALVDGDVRKGRVPASSFEGRHYRRLLWSSLFV